MSPSRKRRESQSESWISTTTKWLDLFSSFSFWYRCWWMSHFKTYLSRKSFLYQHYWLLWLLLRTALPGKWPDLPKYGTNFHNHYNSHFWLLVILGAFQIIILPSCNTDHSMGASSATDDPQKSPEMQGLLKLNSCPWVTDGQTPVIWFPE